MDDEKRPDRVARRRGNGREGTCGLCGAHGAHVPIAAMFRAGTKKGK